MTDLPANLDHDATTGACQAVTSRTESLWHTRSMTTLRDIWSAQGTAFGGWLSIPSSVSAESAARAGFDYVCVDTQHGAVEYQPSLAMIQAILLGGSRPVVRVPWNEPGIIGKALDAGAEGVIVPMVNSPAEAEAVVVAARYPPRGARSFGPTLVGMRTRDVVGSSSTDIAVIPMIETRQALDAIDDILAVPGIDAIYVGPADLSLSLGLPPGNNDGAPAFDDALHRIVEACRRAGIVPGIHATGELAARRHGQGFRMITVSADLPAMRVAMGKDLAMARTGASGSGSAGMY
jgi:4-hydroxy-2-oxoheptanedioate aldolase